eukprot:4516618-Prymnesium_polylepis.1
MDWRAHFGPPKGTMHHRGARGAGGVRLCVLRRRCRCVRVGRWASGVRGACGGFVALTPHGRGLLPPITNGGVVLFNGNGA